MIVFLYSDGDHRDLHVLTHSLPTRRSSALCCVLAHHLSKVVARAREGRTDDGNVVFELVRRQSVAELGIDLLAPKRRVGLDHWTPLREAKDRKSTRLNSSH